MTQNLICFMRQSLPTAVQQTVWSNVSQTQRNYHIHVSLTLFNNPNKISIYGDL